MTKSELNSTIIYYLSQFQPEKIGIFGSYARDEAISTSDIDILVKFKNTISLFDVVKIERELSELIGIKVDLVTESAIKNDILKRNIMNDLEVIYH